MINIPAKVGKPVPFSSFPRKRESMIIPIEDNPDPVFQRDETNVITIL